MSIRGFLNKFEMEGFMAQKRMVESRMKQSFARQMPFLKKKVTPSESLRLCTKKIHEQWTTTSRKTWEKRKESQRERERKIKRLSRGNVLTPVSVEAFDIFSQGEMSEWDSCGVGSGCRTRVGSSCRSVGSVAGSDVLVLAGVGVSAPSVVTVVGRGCAFGL